MIDRVSFVARFMLIGFVLYPSVFAVEAIAGSENPQRMPMTAVNSELKDDLSSDELFDFPEETMRLSMEFQDVNIKDILKIFSEQTGINVIAGSQLQDTPITLYLEDVSALDALDQILRTSNLVYERPLGSEIYIVKELEEEGRATLTKIYRLKFSRVSTSLLAQVEKAFNSASPYEAQGGVEGAGGGAGGGGVEASGIDLIIGALLTENGSLAVDNRTNSLIVTDVPENFPRIEALIAALDVKTRQIMIAAELLETSLSTVQDLGFDWGTGADGTILTLVPSGRTTRFPFQDIGGNSIFGGSTTFASTADITFADGSTLNNVTAAGQAGLGIIDTTTAKMTLEALRSDTETKILARPKILTMDNQSAVIRLTTNQVVGFTSTNQSSTGATSVEPEREKTGVVLSVTPQINEGGYITLAIEPSVTKTVASQVTPPSGAGSVVDPKTRSVRTIVRILSGDTLVLGGLIDRTEEQVDRRVPLLGDIPIFGKMFRSTDINNSSSELIIFITPTILDETSIQQIAAAVTPTTLREQEPIGSRTDSIEHSLNALENATM